MQNEILELLKNNSSVIIPEIGAIMIKPGTGSLIFNEFLKFNDGLLTDHLIKTRNIEKVEASKEIKNFTTHIIKSLAKDKLCDLMPLGVLYIDENDKILIKSTLSFDIGTDNIETSVNKSVINETEKIEAPYNPPTSNLLENSNNVVNPKITKENKAMFENVPKSQNEDKSFNDDYYPPKERSVKKVLVISFLLIILVAAGIYFAFLKEPNFFSRNEDIPDEMPVVKKEVSAPSSMVTEPEVQSSVASIDNSKNKFHIIAGAFVVEKNAAAFMETLEQKGFEPKIVLKRNQYSFISVYSCPTFKEANYKFKSFEGTGMPVWIMRY